MSGRILSLRWRKLMAIGFVVDDRFIGLRNLRSSLSAFLKHPAMLVVLGFVLTGVIGNYLVYLENERQRQNDATVKSMDEVRAAFDDLSMAFSEYQFRANRLIALEESGASPDAIATARKPYDDAVQNWKEHEAVDNPKIGADYFQATALGNMGLSVTYIDMGIDAVDECLNLNVRQVDSSGEVSLACKNKFAMTRDVTIPGVSVESRMFLVSHCVSFFTTFVRPNPATDFQDVSSLSDSPPIKTLNVICDPTMESYSLQHMIDELGKREKSSKVAAATLPATR
jgi:hypothetical protein